MYTICDIIRESTVFTQWKQYVNIIEIKNWNIHFLHHSIYYHLYTWAFPRLPEEMIIAFEKMKRAGDYSDRDSGREKYI